MCTVIRKYADRDRDAVLSAWENASKLAHPFLTSEFIEIERANILSIAIPNTETWVAEEDDQVIGFISIIRHEVGLLFVQPSHQRQGAGSALMDKARDERRNLNVDVFKANSIGRAFYDKYGFTYVCEKVHELTGDELVRLSYTPPRA